MEWIPVYLVFVDFEKAFDTFVVYSKRIQLAIMFLLKQGCILLPLMNYVDETCLLRATNVRDLRNKYK